MQPSSRDSEESREIDLGDKRPKQDKKIKTVDKREAERERKANGKKMESGERNEVREEALGGCGEEEGSNIAKKSERANTFAVNRGSECVPCGGQGWNSGYWLSRPQQGAQYVP